MRRTKQTARRVKGLPRFQLMSYSVEEEPPKRRKHRKTKSKGVKKPVTCKKPKAKSQ